MQVGRTPMIVSLHATKIFGIGEGGMVLTTNTDLIKRVKGISNFGFDVSRMSSYIGMNAKMSEYQAAIGLAVLDAWEETRLKRLDVTKHYLALFAELGLAHWLSTDWLSYTCNVFLPHFAEQARDALLASNIETRIWWHKGCHTHPAYQHLPKELQLPNTAYLGKSMLGLPFSLDTSETEIALIGECLGELAELCAAAQHAG
jgi:dTDP-4-amino-4,6-dideoxygalactose transaminase